MMSTYSINDFIDELVEAGKRLEEMSSTIEPRGRPQFENIGTYVRHMNASLEQSKNVNPYSGFTTENTSDLNDIVRQELYVGLKIIKDYVLSTINSDISKNKDPSIKGLKATLKDKENIDYLKILLTYAI